VKTCKVEIASRAEVRMYDHFEFLARVSVRAAEKLLGILKRDLKMLEKNPFAYPYYNRPASSPHKYRYLLPCSRYRIVYQVIGETVYVDDIQDCRQDDEKNLIT
jgi:mRNA-degrading endonuclease RelE of RelBE toxin-antitoxin system